MREVVLDAPAKVNLFLHVLDRGSSGYHAIETLFAAVALHDTVRLRRTASSGVRLRVEGPHDLGPPARNLATRAAEAYLERVGDGSTGIEIALEKEIPPGAGLGGGSSDAAATLRALDRMLEGPMEARGLVELAAGLGADVPFFLAPTPLALGWGRGDRLLSLPPLPERPVVVAVPTFRVSTAEAYADLDRQRDRDTGRGGARNPGPAGAPNPGPAGGPDAGRGGGTDAGPGGETDAEPGGGPDAGPYIREATGRVLEGGELSEWDGVAALARNDFEVVVGGRHPGIDELRGALAAEGARPCLLSGSGSAVFGVFGDPGRARAAGRRIGADFPDVEVRVTRTLSRWPQPRTT